MIKWVGVVKRRPDITHAEFLRHWRDVHGPLAAAMPGLRRYVQNPPLEVPGREPRYDGVAELWFDDLASLRASFQSPQGQKVGADQAEFIDQEHSFSLFVEEREVPLRPAGDGG